MQSIADQVAVLEHNYAAALSQIDMLTQSLAAVTAEKTALEAQAVELKQHDEETRAAAEGLANAALDMLRISQRPAGTPAEVIKFAPKTTAPSASATAIEQAVAAALVDPPAQAWATEIMTRDSGDEQPTAPQIKSTPSSDNGSSEVTQHGGSTPSEGARPPADPQPSLSDGVDAMSRIMPTARALPIVSFVREPTGPMLVRDSAPLPMFLQRDTVFQRGNLTVS